MSDQGRKNEPGAKGDPDPKDNEGETLKLLTTNLSVVTWIVFVGFGGALLTLYYMQINYFPEIAWRDSFTYLASISLLGGGAVVTYGLLVFVPGAIWSEFLIFDTELRLRLCCDPPNQHEPCYWNTILHLVAPFATLMTMVHLARFFGVDWVEPVAVGGLMALVAYYHFVFGMLLEGVYPKSNHRSRRTKAVAAAGFAALAGVTSLLVIYHFVVPVDSKSGGPEWTEWPLLVVCTVVVVVSNHFVAVQFRNRLGRAVVTGILAGLVLLFSGEILGGRNKAHSKRILESFGIGESAKPVTLLVNDDGQKILKKIFPSEGFADGLVQKTRILSRLGSEYCLQINGRKVILPKGMVISWVEEEASSGAPGTPLSPPIAAVAPPPSTAQILFRDSIALLVQQETSQRTFLWIERLVGDLIALLIGFSGGRYLGIKVAQSRRKRSQDLLLPLADGTLCAVIPQGTFSSLYITELALAELHARFEGWGLPRMRECYRDELVHLPEARVILCPEAALSDLQDEAQKIDSKLRRAEAFYDYGLIYWRRNPNQRNKSLLVIAGDRSDLVQAGVRYALSRSILSRLNARRSEEVELLIRVDAGRGAHPDIRPVFLRPDVAIGQ